MKTRLTNTLLKTLEPREKYYRIWDSAQPGLFVRISPRGRKVFSLRFISKEGKDRAFTLGSYGKVTLDQARASAKKHLGEVVQGIDIQIRKRKAKQSIINRRETTLRGFIDKYYKDFLEAQRKTGAELLASLNTHFGDYYDRQLTELDVRTLTSWRNKRLKAGILPASVNRNISTLKAALNRAVEWNIIEENPLAKFKPLKLDKRGKVRFLDQDEESRLRQALAQRDMGIAERRSSANDWRETRNYELLKDIPANGYADHVTPVVLLAINTGMRRGELFQLSWANTDLERCLITVEGDTAKSGQTRHIPLNKEACMVLAKWREQRSDDGLVFPSPVTHGTLNNIKKAWNTLLKSAQISHFRFHDCRHHFASKLVMKGVDLNTVRELLGHASIEMTLRYAHLAPQHKAAAVALLDD